MTAKLNQILAIEKGVKSRVYGEITNLHKLLQKPALFNGFYKEYKPSEEEGKKLPPESTKVQYTVPATLQQIRRLMSEYFEVAATRDWTNNVAKADIIIDDVVLLKDVPVTYMLFLEKQLLDIRTMINELPILDDAENWTMDVNTGYYRTPETLTHRTEKRNRPIVLYDATDKHPAQTQLLAEDVLVGYWHHTKSSGALKRPERLEMSNRVDKFLDAVKKAREKANSVEVVAAPKVGETLFNYILGDLRAS